jgi:hypothetical protein
MKMCLQVLENKTALLRKFYSLENTSLIVGFESLKNNSGALTQNFIRFLGKKLIVKTKKGIRLGFLHTNTTSLAFANLGINAGVRSVLNLNMSSDKNINNLFVVQPFELSSKK